MRVIFFGSPPFATPILGALLESHHRPVAVVTQPAREAGRGRRPQPSPVAELAEAHGIGLLRPESAREPAFQAQLRALQPDVLLVASYGELLDEALLSIAPRGALNVHGSLLPRWRGASPVQAAILAGDARTGVSIQRMVRKLDAGDVLLARETEIEAEETGGALTARLATLGAEAAIAALDLVRAGRAEFTSQDDSLVTHCRKIPKSAGWIDWTQSAEQLARHVRAFTPWPGARSRLADGRELTVVRSRAEPEVTDAPRSFIEGSAIERSAIDSGALDREALARGELRVATGSGWLQLLEVQPAGKRALAVGEWLRGARLDPHSAFVSADAGEDR